jgi:hypothetical protein
MKFLCWFLFAASAFGAETPSKLSAKYLEYQDKVQDFSLELFNANATVANSVRALEQLQAECEHAERLVKKGYEHTNLVVGCRASVVAAQTQLEQQKSAVKALERNRDIWTVRLAGEAGEAMDLKVLAEAYTSKWRVAADLQRAQLENSKSRLRQAETFYEWAKRQRIKGYMTEFDYQRAYQSLTSMRTELAAQELREKEIDGSLRKLEADLAEIQKSR